MGITFACCFLSSLSLESGGSPMSSSSSLLLSSSTGGGGARVPSSKTSLSCATTTLTTTLTTLRARYCRNTNRPMTKRMSNTNNHRAETPLPQKEGATDARGRNTTTINNNNRISCGDAIVNDSLTDPPPSGTAFDVVVIGNGPIGAAIGLHVSSSSTKNVKTTTKRKKKMLILDS